MQYITCNSNNYHITYNFECYFNPGYNINDLLWNDLMKKHRFKIDINALGYVTATLNAYSC